MRKKDGKKKADFFKRRVFALFLSAAMAVGCTLPVGAGSLAYGLEPEGGQRETELPESELSLENGLGGGANEPAAGEAKLFQSMTGADLRTYATEADWYLGITKMESKTRLYTEKQTTDYGGQVITNKYLNEPQKGMAYVIVNLALSKVVTGGENFQAADLTLTINGNPYKRILEDSFLTNHDYDSFPNSEILAGSRNGDVVFEVSASDAAAVADWKTALGGNVIRLEAGPVAGKAVEVNEDELIPVPMGGYLVDRQFQMETDLLKEYQAGSYGISSPFFSLNPYGTTPLAGLAMFRTEQEAAVVEVTVKGKRETENISYTVTSGGIEHQVPVIGLYAGTNNTYTLTAKTAAGAVLETSGELRVQTASGGNYPKPTLATGAEPEAIEPGVTAMWVQGAVIVIDAKADVRWYENLGLDGAWGANLITDRGTIYFPDVSNGTKSNPSVIYEMTWYGKIIAQYLQSGAIPDAHHDLEETPEGSFLVGINNDIYSNAIAEIDKVTGARVKVISTSAIVEKSVNSGAGDWSHLNTITSVGDDHYLLSMRNQDLVFEYDYKNDEILWALSSKKNISEKVNSKMVTLDTSKTDSNGHPFLYSSQQHHVTLLPDLDKNSNTVDILMLDNGVARQRTRVVHYRINLKDRTAEQIYAAGDDLADFYGGAWGSAQWLEQTGNYLGTAASNNLIEFGPDSKVIWKAKVNASSYRAFRIPCSTFAQAEVSLGTQKGKAFMHVGEETPFVPTELPANTSEKISVDIKGVYLHEQQLLLEGSAYGSKSSAVKSVFLVADDGKQQYYAPLISNSTAYTFDHTLKTAKPLTAAGLPQGRYQLGILVQEGSASAYKKTEYYLEKTGSLKTELTDDQGQREIVEELIGKAKDESNTLNDPVVVVNPFEKAPLSAIAAFYTESPCTVEVTVKGKPASGDRIQADVTYSVDGGRTNNHIVPIIGLYEDYENTVELRTSDGKISVISVWTGSVNEMYVRQADITATAEQRHQAASGLTFLTPAGAQTVPMAIDVNGDLRWIYTCAAAAPLETKPLADGHFLVPSDRPSTEVFVTDAETALEIDLTGRIYAEYFLDGMPHHEVFERENGNLIFALSRRNSTSIEDYMAEVDRETGETIRTWDFRAIFGIPEYDASYDPEKGGTDDLNGPHRANPSIQLAAGNHPYSDWFHQNSLYYDEGDPRDPSDDAIYVTGRHQSCLVKLNAEKAAGEHPSTEAIDWIYTDPAWLPQSSLDLKSLVLTPEQVQTAALTSKEAAAVADMAALEVKEEESPEPTVEQEKTGTSPDSIRDAVVNELSEANRSGESAGSGEIDGKTGKAVVEPDAESKESVQSAERTESNGAMESAELTESIKNVEAAVSAVSAVGAEPADNRGADLEADQTDQKSLEPQPYVYGPHAVERMANGDFILYDNNLYGSKTEMTTDASHLSSRAVRLRVDESSMTFSLEWEYGTELGSSHYTPFIGDVDYLGEALSEGDEVTDNHYLINFGGITKNAAGEACDVVAAMLGGTISADIREYQDGEILWSAYLKGSPGKVSSVYRAERVDLAAVPISGLDYESYREIENRGMYTNTPQADRGEVNDSILNAAARGVLPVSWSMLRDEGNRLIGKFTLPHVLTDTAPDSLQAKNVYVVLDMGSEGRRIYKAGYNAAQPALGVKEGYYKFEIMKDNKAAQLQLLLERQDGVRILGSTGEVASASMQYITGEIPVIDAAAPAVTVKDESGAPILGTLAAWSGNPAGTLIVVEKGTLEPGKQYVYVEPGTGKETKLFYSPIHGGYVLILDGETVSQTGAEARIKVVNGTVENLRSGVVADNRYESVNGEVRTKVISSDLFYLYNQVTKNCLPYTDLGRSLAMDVTGDFQVSNADIMEIMRLYLFQ